MLLRDTLSFSSSPSLPSHPPLFYNKDPKCMFAFVCDAETDTNADANVCLYKEKKDKENWDFKNPLLVL